MAQLPARVRTDLVPRAKALVDAVGLGAPARTVKRLVEGTLVRQNRRDDERIKLLLAFLLRGDSNCIDVGAHTGSVLSLFTKYAPEGRHIAYEPLPGFWEPLAQRFPTVDVRGKALGDSTGGVPFTFVRSRPTHSGFLERTYPGKERTELITVEVERLDDALPGDYVPNVIKIDVEGAELQVLRGATRTLVAHKPTVVFEHGVGAADHYGTAAKDVFALLCTEAGLRIFDLDGNGPLSLAEFEDAASGRHRRWNYVAHA